MATATIHIDGGSRGNPGPASYAVVLRRPGHDTIDECDRLGTATNNVAEYTALIRGLELARAYGVRELEVFSDSELLVKQMRGEYKVKNVELKGLNAEAAALCRRLGVVSFTHVLRGQNREADRLCNEALDGRPRPRTAVTTATGGDAGVTLAPVDARRDDAIALLTGAADCWATRGLAEPTVEDIVDRLRAILTREPPRPA